MASACLFLFSRLTEQISICMKIHCTSTPVLCYDKMTKSNTNVKFEWEFWKRNFENEILDYPHFSANFLKFSFFMTFTSLMTLTFNIRSPKISMALNFNIMSEITPVSKCKSNYRISIYLSIKTHVFKLRFS